MILLPVVAVLLLVLMLLLLRGEENSQAPLKLWTLGREGVAAGTREAEVCAEGASEGRRGTACRRLRAGVGERPKRGRKARVD
jgi:hypothetical protein